MKRQTIEYVLMGFTTILICAVLCALSINALQQKRSRPGATAKYSVSSNVLQQQFSADEQIATITYLNSVLAVDGIVKSVEKNHNGDFTVLIGDTVSNVVIRCAVEKSYNEEASALHTGVAATFKGICKGFNVDKLAGLNVMLTGCSIHR